MAVYVFNVLAGSFENIVEGNRQALGLLECEHFHLVFLVFLSKCGLLIFYKCKTLETFLGIFLVQAVYSTVVQVPL